MSKLLYSLLPKSLTAVALCVIPIASLTVIVCYPKFVTQFFLPPVEALLEDDSKEVDASNEVGKKKRKRNNRHKNGGEARSMSPAAALEEVANESSSVDADEVDEEEALLQLAAIRGKTSVAYQVKLEKSDSPTFSDISIESGEGWSKVPTKTEEALESLKSRLSTITKQKDEFEAECQKLQKQLEKQQATNFANEQDSKDQIKGLQMRCASLDGECTRLKAFKVEATQQVEEFAQLKSKLDEQKLYNVQLLGKIEEMDNTYGLLQQAVAQNNELSGQISHLEKELSRAVENSRKQIKELETSNVLTKNELIEKVSRVDVLEKELEESMKCLKDCEATLKTLKKENVEMSSQMASNQDNGNALSELKKQNEDLTSQIANFKSLEDENNSLKSEITTFKSSLESSASEIENLKSLLETSNKSIDANEKLVAKYITDLENIKSYNLKDMESFKAMQEEQFAARISELESASKSNEFQVEFELAQQKISAYETSIAKYESKMASIEEELIKAKEECESLKNIIAVAKSNDSDSTSKLEELQKEIEKQKDLLKQAEEKLNANSANDNKDLKLELEKASKRAQILSTVSESKYASFKADILKLTNERDELVKQVESFKRSSEMVDKLVAESS